MIHMSYRSFLFLTDKATYPQVQNMSQKMQLKNKSACGLQVSDWSGHLRKMMWVCSDRKPHEWYAQKVTCQKYIKLLKENGL